MKVKWNERSTTRAVYVVITFTACLIVWFIGTKISALEGYLAAFMKALAPIIWGFVIAYLLNPVMKATEKLCSKLFERKAPHPKLCRMTATIVSIIFGLAVIIAVIAIIVPQFLESLMTIFNNMPTYWNNLYNWVDKLLISYPEIAVYANQAFESLQNTITNFTTDLLPKIGNYAVKLKDGAVSLVGGVLNFIIGFIVAVYFLADKEKFSAQVKKFLTAVFPEKTRELIFHIGRRTNKYVGDFLAGKILDSAIIGCICFVALKFMGIEYAVLISVIIGVTNVIPVFGPFIGAIPSGLLVLVTQPEKTIAFIIMIVILQQLDGNIIGPHILGDSTGLSAFWVMFAIFIGGGLFGFMGMLLGVPVFAVIYELTREFCEDMLKKKQLPAETSAYLPVPEEEPPKEKKPIKIPFVKGKGDKK